MTILILTFYMLVEARLAAGLVAAAVSARAPRARRRRPAATSTVKVSAWLGGQLLLADVIGTTSAIGSVGARGAVLLCARAHFGGSAR